MERSIFITEWKEHVKWYFRIVLKGDGVYLMEPAHGTNSPKYITLVMKLKLCWMNEILSFSDIF